MLTERPMQAIQSRLIGLTVSSFCCNRPSQGRRRSSVNRPAIPPVIAERSDSGPETESTLATPIPHENKRVPVNVISGGLPGLGVAPDLQYIDFKTPNEVRQF